MANSAITKAPPRFKPSAQKHTIETDPIYILIAEGNELSTGCKKRQDHSRLEADIKEIYNKICQAFDRLDIDSALSYFADSDNTVKISNGVVLKGKKQLADYWHQNVGKLNDLRITIEDVEIHVIDDQHIWSTADEYISSDGITQKAVVSNIFIQTSRGWKILLDHTTYLK